MGRNLQSVAACILLLNSELAYSQAVQLEHGGYVDHDQNTPYHCFRVQPTRMTEAPDHSRVAFTYEQTNGHNLKNPLTRIGAPQIPSLPGQFLDPLEIKDVPLGTVSFQVDGVLEAYKLQLETLIGQDITLITGIRICHVTDGAGIRNMMVSDRFIENFHDAIGWPGVTRRQQFGFDQASLSFTDAQGRQFAMGRGLLNAMAYTGIRKSIEFRDGSDRNLLTFTAGGDVGFVVGRNPTNNASMNLSAGIAATRRLSQNNRLTVGAHSDFNRDVPLSPHGVQFFDRSLGYTHAALIAFAHDFGSQNPSKRQTFSIALQYEVNRAILDKSLYQQKVNYTGYNFTHRAMLERQHMFCLQLKHRFPSGSQAQLSACEDLSVQRKAFPLSGNYLRDFGITVGGKIPIGKKRR